MILNNVAMIAADTTRTKYYLKEMIKSSLLPSYVLIFLNSSDNILPGQEECDSSNELATLLKDANIKFDIEVSGDINNDKAVTKIANRLEQVFIYSGFGGVLLRNNILNTGKKFLHIHGGYLPNYKGSTVSYYSLINDNTIGASAIFLTKEIDCGPILLRREFKAPENRAEIDHTHDSRVRAIVLIEVLQKYAKADVWHFELENNLGGETFYIIHPVLKHLAILGKEML